MSFIAKHHIKQPRGNAFTAVIGIRFSTFSKWLSGLARDNVISSFFSEVYQYLNHRKVVFKKLKHEKTKSKKQTNQKQITNPKTNKNKKTNKKRTNKRTSKQKSSHMYDGVSKCVF